MHLVHMTLIKHKTLLHAKGRQIIWRNPNYVKQDTGLTTWFDRQQWQEENAILGVAEGRGSTLFIQYQELQLALRQYLRGGLFGKIIKSHYLFRSWQRTRAFQEFELLIFLQTHHAPTPVPIIARAVKRGLIYSADIITLRISNAKNLCDYLKSQPLDEDGYRKIGQAIRFIHDLNVNHTDLNINNILIDEQRCVWIIDFDNCRRMNKDGWWKKRNLSRLKRSFYKEHKRNHIQWQPADWDSLSSGYFIDPQPVLIDNNSDFNETL